MPDVAGLTSEEARRRLAEHGPNRLFEPQPLRFLTILRHEITEPMILLLLFVGLVYSLTGRAEDALTILVVIVALVLAEVWNEFRAKKAIAALATVSAPKARVLRDGRPGVVATEELVPGDVVMLSAGTRIAADADLVRATGLQVDESAMTGESFPVGKKAGDPVFAGTIVVAGEAQAEVTATGPHTRLGRMAGEVATVRPPRTPLQLSMRNLAGRLVYVAVGFSVLIPVIGLLRGQDLRTMFLTGLSLAFATIPEELPIIITMVLGLGAYRLSRRSFLVKQLTAAETLGSVSVIVTDKTGTLTENHMTVGSTYPADRADEVLRTALGVVVEYAPSTSPIDSALKEAAAQKSLQAPDGEISRLHDIGDGRRTKAAVRGGVLYVSGAPEEVLAECAQRPPGVEDEIDSHARQGMRAIAVARRVLAPVEQDADWPRIERELEFVGVIGFVDPPRPGVAETIRDAALAGIRTVMVTGDYPATAAAIARQTGIIGADAAAEPVMTGAELQELSDEALRSEVERVSLFARTTPQDKYRIVKALQASGGIVAVTGDGINDALALRGADVGIAMGIRGTDVAREAAAAVLADDDYVTIARAVWEGRGFFDNLRKGVKYYLSVKVALIAVFLLPVLVGLPLPFAPIQIIVLELFMDLGASAGFVAEKAEADIRRRRPRPRAQALFDAANLKDLFVKGLFLFAGVTAVYVAARAGGLPYGEQRTLAFSAWIVGHVVLAFVSRSDTRTLVDLGVFSNRSIDLWAASAAAFLLIWVYVPALGRPLGLVPVPGTLMVAVAVGMTAWIFLLQSRVALASRRDRSALRVDRLQGG